MNIIDLFITAVGLSMDAFAVAVCKGLPMRRVSLKKAAVVGLYFGLFQALMPLLGYFIGIQFQQQIEAFDHWIAFILLGVIGINMIREALRKDDSDTAREEDLSFKTMTILAIATSIDALAVGVTFAFLKTNILFAVIFIGITTFLLSMLGAKIGSSFGTKYCSRAEIFGGVVLILMGTKILIEHLM